LRPRQRRRFRLVAITALAIYQRDILYPTSVVAQNDAWTAPGVTRVAIKTDDGEHLRGWRTCAPTTLAEEFRH